MILRSSVLILAALTSLAAPHDMGLARPDSVEIEPGDPLLRSADAKPYTARWRQWVTMPDGSRHAGINTIHDKVIVRPSGADVSDLVGPEVIVRDLLWVDTSNNTYRRVDVFDRGSLAPIRMDIRQSPHSVTHVEFDGTAVESLQVDDPTRPGSRSTANLDRLAFNWSSDGFLLGALSLDGLEELSLPTADNLTDAPGVERKVFTVVGRETIETIPFGSHDTLVVKETKAGSYWGQYWVSDRAPYIVRVQFTEPGGTVTTWELF